MGRRKQYPRAQVKGRELHAVLARRGATFRELAMDCGISTKTLFDVGGGLEIPLATAERIARAAGALSVESIFRVIERPTQQGELEFRRRRLPPMPPPKKEDAIPYKPPEPELELGLPPPRAANGEK